MTMSGRLQETINRAWHEVPFVKWQRFCSEWALIGAFYAYRTDPALLGLDWTLEDFSNLTNATAAQRDR